EIRRLLLRRWKAIRPELHRPVRLWTLARRLVALLVEDGDVERRISGPGTQDPVVEIQPVHLRARDLDIDLARDGPAAHVEGGEPALKGGQLAVLGGHRRRAVVRNASDEPGALEGAPFAEESKEIRVVAVARCGRSRRSAGAAGEKCGGERSGRMAHGRRSYAATRSGTRVCPSPDEGGGWYDHVPPPVALADGCALPTTPVWVKGKK